MKRREVLGEKSWDTGVLEDFSALREAKLMHPLMDEIEKLFARLEEEFRNHSAALIIGIRVP
jgi:hypothetical protein